jgi:hypothetical protein
MAMCLLLVAMSWARLDMGRAWWPWAGLVWPSALHGLGCFGHGHVMGFGEPAMGLTGMVMSCPLAGLAMGCDDQGLSGHGLDRP